MKNFKSYLKDDLAGVQKANRKKLAAVVKGNKEKEKSIRMADQEKKKDKQSAEADKQQADREKLAQTRAADALKKSSKKESIIQKVVEYIKSDGVRKKCAGGDGRRTENHDCDKIHSGMSHDEWEASQDTPKDEGKDGGTGDKEAYKKFFDAKLKKYGVSSPADLKGDDKKKFYDEIDAEWEGDNEED
jgi:hypothetical protein